MTGWREDDGVLRDAYQAAVARSSGDCAPEDVNRIWQAVAGELDVDARRDLIDRMATDPALAQAWRVAVELDRARGGVATSGRQTTRWLPQAFMGLAAAVIIAVGIRVFLVDRAPADTFRAGAGTVVESLIASDAALPADAFVLRWKPGPAGTALRAARHDRGSSRPDERHRSDRAGIHRAARGACGGASRLARALASRDVVDRR